MSRSFVRVRFEIPGFHFWRAAPPDVSFLRYPHRHVFKFEVMAKTSKGREIEFFRLQRTTKGAVHHLSLAGEPLDGFLEAGKGTPLSCEEMASAVAEYLDHESYPVVEVVVSEDGENDGLWRAE